MSTETTSRQNDPHEVTGIYLTPNKTWCSYIQVNGDVRYKNFKSKDLAILQRYIWELNEWGKNAPQLQDIVKTYPRLVHGMNMGYMISDNPQLVIAILNKLSEDEHCPCRLEKNEDTKCICKEFREIDEGMCHCGLYIKTLD